LISENKGDDEHKQLFNTMWVQLSLSLSSLLFTCWFWNSLCR